MSTKCAYCPRDAVIGGEAPVGTGGIKYLLACEIHAHRIKSLGFIEKDIGEIRLALRREERNAKAN